MDRTGSRDLHSCSSLCETVATNPKKFVIASDASSVVIEGSWNRLTNRPSTEVPEVNSFRIECYSQARICREYIAKLIRPTDAQALVESTHYF